MQILLTGGSGSVGKAIVDRLTRRGFGVRVIGRRADLSFPGAEYRSCDINDYPSLREAIRGCDAVVHLAAVPNPGQTPNQELFRINASGTFNVFQAAAEEGIQRVVQASSINATGQFYGLKPAPLHYLPIDEEHPTFSTDVYSFSKNVIEEIGQYFWRREGISSLAYRLPWVAPQEVHTQMQARQARSSGVVERLRQLSPGERRSWFDSAWRMYNEFRATRPYESGLDVRKVLNEMPEETRNAIYTMNTLFINDSQNNTGTESRLLAELFYPDVMAFKKELAGTETLVSIDRARQLIGFEPEYSFS